MSTKSKKDKRTSRRKTRVDKTSTDGKRTRAGSKSRKRSKTDGKRHTVHTKHTIKLKSQKSTVYSLDTPRRQNVSPKTSKTPKASKHSVSKSSSRHHRQRSKSVSGAQIKSLSKRPKSARNRKSVEKVPDFESQTSGESESLATTESLFSAPVSNLSISMDVEEATESTQCNKEQEMIIQNLQRQNNEYAANNEILRNDLDAVNLKYKELVAASSKTDARNKVTIEALQSKIISIQQHAPMTLSTSTKSSLSPAQQLILVNGIVGSAHYACFIPAVLESITLRPSSNSLKYLSLFAGFNAFNGFYTLLVLPQSKQTGRQMVQYLAFSNMLSIAASAFCFYKKPKMVSTGYLLMSSAVNVGMLSLSMYMLPSLTRIEDEREVNEDQTILDRPSLMVTQ